VRDRVEEGNRNKGREKREERKRKVGRVYPGRKDR